MCGGEHTHPFRVATWNLKRKKRVAINAMDGQILYKRGNRKGYLFASSRVVVILNLDMLIISYFFQGPLPDRHGKMKKV